MALSLQRYLSPGIDDLLYPMVKERFKRERESSRAIVLQIGMFVPENMLVEILSWLPVKALLQFKSVCKSWYAIISSPDFIRKHLQNYYKNNKGDSSCLLAQYYVTYAELQLHELLVDETSTVLAHGTLYYVPSYGSNICGPCDGLYYLYNYNTKQRALWNPATNEVKGLPPVITKPNLASGLSDHPTEFYGFGVDSVSQDYKVIVIKGYWIFPTDESESENENEDDTPIRCPLSIFTYSLKEDTWRYWGDCDRYYELEQSLCYSFVNGCFYWLALSTPYGEPEVVVSFNMSSDECREICVPDCDLQPASNSIGVYHDSLALFCVHDNSEMFSIWTYKAGAWAKEVTMRTDFDLRCPVGHWMNDKVLIELAGEFRLVLFDPEKEALEAIGFEMFKWCQGVFCFKESLVSI